MGIQNTSDLTAMINVDRNEIRIAAELSIGGRTVDKVFKIDTGAGFTCMNAADLGMEMDEITFSAMNTSGKIIARGVDNVTKLTYYKYQLNNFKIGTLDMGSVPIYITFNQFAAKRLLGMDLLGLLNITIINDHHIVYLEKTKEFKAFQQKNTKLYEPSKVCLYKEEDLDYIESFSFSITRL